MPEGASAAMASAQELFVYYRVVPDDAAALGAAVRAMHAALASAHPGLQARLLRRPEVAQGRLTLMEVYARPPAGIDAGLRAEIDTAARALAPWLDGERHTEVFVPCA